MNRFNIKLFTAVVATSMFCNVALAGNPDRAGQAGATELLINPWARSTGWSTANTGGVRGLESVFGNVAGIAFTKKSEVLFSRTNHMKGSDININSFGIAQRVGEGSVMAVSVMSMNFGDIEVTTVDKPEGGIGTFSPQFININLSYAKSFSKTIHGGINLKIIDQSISNVRASGFAIDAGIQYVTGTNSEKDNVKFGITLRNVGTPMKFGGDGLSTKLTAANGADLTISQRSEKFEIPSMLNIGGAYDFKLAEDHRLTMAGTFTSNSFTNDQFSVGLEYGFKEMIMLRAGYTYEKDLGDALLRNTVFTGPAAGVSFELPLGKNGKKFAIDYSYRTTNPFNGSHAFGGRFVL
ncbi:MAG: hypothetical protein RIQ89_1614 [Bacteroidota bacterium]|jgi:hypothetical protein